MNLGFSEMFFIFLLALIIFGPKKLPEIGRQIGKALNEFKRASREFQSQIEDEVRTLERETDFKNTIAPPALMQTVSSKPSLLTMPSTANTTASIPNSEPSSHLAESTLAASDEKPEPSYKAESAGNA
ncbi:MAG TPA: twin-arginine translocase TatA/TatE family subunit [Terriglobales bacterium]|nr:twin-arginine translocase TatA/TatE family subunit [Terriglobales bacterium]